MPGASTPSSLLTKTRMIRAASRRKGIRRLTRALYRSAAAAVRRRGTAKLPHVMSKPHKTTVSAEDLRLFVEAIGPVRPVVSDHAPVSVPRPSPEPLQSQLDEARVAGETMFSE